LEKLFVYNPSPVLELLWPEIQFKINKKTIEKIIFIKEDKDIQILVN